MRWEALTYSVGVAGAGAGVARATGESYDLLAAELQRLRLERGAPSYAQLASRITQARLAQGFLPAAASVAKSSVYDLFRPGRKRVNPELLAETVRALGCTEDQVRQWRRRAVAARADVVRPYDTRTAAPVRGRSVALAVVLCIAAVGVSLFTNFTASALHVPLYLDMVGTAFAAFAFGPWVGAAVGVATNLTGNLMNGDFTGWGFAIVQVAGAVVWGYGFRGWFGRGPWRFLSLNVVVALVCSVVAVPVILVFFGGVSSLPGVATLAEAAQQLGASMSEALLSVNMLTSVVDKLISGCVALALVWLLARYGYALAGIVRERLGMTLGRLAR